MDGPDITDHQSDLELSNRVVLNRGQIQPGGKIYLKTIINIKDTIRILNFPKKYPNLVIWLK